MKGWPSAFNPVDRMQLANIGQSRMFEVKGNADGVRRTGCHMILIIDGRNSAFSK